MAGVVTNDIVGPALLGGLVLIVMLIGFTVMQHAFAGGITHGIVSDVERRALALTGAGDMIWDWDVSADKVFTSPEPKQLLGLKRGALEGPAARWLEVLHPLDRDRFRAALDGVLEQRRGRLMQDFRLRTPDGHYLWFALKARPVVGSDGEVVRLVGTLTDVTEFKNAEERLLHDAVHDNLTGLPNRELFLDRLEVGARRCRKADTAIRPTVMVIDLDRFKQVNDSVGIAVGDFDPADAGAPARPPAQAAGHAGAACRRSVRADPAVGAARSAGSSRSPRRCARRCARRSPSTTARFFLTASIGLALGEAQPPQAEEFLKDAELAMYHAKRVGGDRIEVFKPAMRARKIDRLTLESELRRAHRARGDHHPLSADRPARGPLGRGLRGAGALGSSQDGPPVARRIHRHRGGDRADRRPRPVRAGAHRAPARDLAARHADVASRCSPASTCRRANCCGRT